MVVAKRDHTEWDNQDPEKWKWNVLSQLQFPALNLQAYVQFLPSSKKKKVSLQYTETVIENQNQSKCKGRNIMWCLIPTGISMTHFLHLRIGIIVEEGVKRLWAREIGSLLWESIS